jgi:polo-like kinase 4
LTIYIRFVKLIRSKTPKITFYTREAKCILLERIPDFEVQFYDGLKCSIMQNVTKIVNIDGSTILLDSNSRSTLVNEETQSILERVNKVY